MRAVGGPIQGYKDGGGAVVDVAGLCPPDAITQANTY